MMNRSSRHNSLLYGSGTFTTLAVHNGQPLFVDKHVRRLNTDSSRLGLAFSIESPKLEGLIHEQLATENIQDGRVRVTLVDESSSSIWSDSTESRITLSIIVAGRRTVLEHFKLAISTFPVNSRSPLAGVKSCNYLEQILSLDEAKSRGFHEAVRVNERGHVTSGCMSNIFWLKDERLYTPTLATGCLAGTTREHVLENVDCEEVEVEIGELESADAIYLTSAGLGIVSIAEFDGRELTAGDHPILDLWPPKDVKTRMPTIGQS